MPNSNNLVTDLKEITNCPFYWGKVGAQEAEKLLDGKPNGTYLLRDSSHRDYMFVISIRFNSKFVLHKRIGLWSNRIYFGCPYRLCRSSAMVALTALVRDYKDRKSKMLFGAILQNSPLHRNFPFDLKHIARVALCNRLTYNSISKLPLPNFLKNYLKE